MIGFRGLCRIAIYAGLMAGTVVPASAQMLSFAPIDRNSTTFPQAPSNDALVAPDELPTALRRQIVAYSGNEPAGTIIVDTAHTYLYLTLGSGRAMRYGIGVGR